MQTLHIQGKTGNSTLLIGEKLEHLGKYMAGASTVAITDYRLWDLYRDKFPPLKVIKIGTGEKAKTLETVRNIYAELIALEMDRSALIVGIGGGIVCDITGFVASTYLRGVRFGFVSTTLLAQVDASVGGKNGVNFGGYKNMVGTFNQPEFVLCDLNLLKTLAKREICSGFAEIVKQAAIADAGLFEYLEANYQGATALDARVIEKLVYDSVVIKSTIVNQDEKETGERRKLNFGHTFGHAIEKTTGITHGEAVSAGMVIAAALSVKKGLLSFEDAARISMLLEKLNLPSRIQFEPEALLDALKRDKKRKGHDIQFVLLDKIGHAVVTHISIEELNAFLQTGQPRY